MFFKKMMIWVIIMTIFISFSSNSWFIFWLMMEINMMSFIPILNNFKMKNYNAMITYFIVQSFSSSLFFISAFQYNLFNLNFFFNLINISILIKMGVIPFHFWMIMLSESLTYFSLFILLTIQKIMPLLIIEKFINTSLTILFVLSSLTASILAMKYKMMKKILIFSSISHQGWILCLIAKKINFWISYLILYSIIIYNIINICNYNNFNNIYDFIKKKMKTENKTSLIMSMMSLAGMPPFLGFFMKIVALFFLMKMNMIMIFMLIISSLINLFFYMRSMTPSFFINLKFFSWNNLLIKKNFLFKMNLILLIILMNIFI
uniref:NADH-ubiquinone oxidoreductase chain 2 n=1 Tax=Rhipicephalus appendiculatus TaxID=34631 RepID=A0A7G9TYP5_RHIAP|nr:NADH dehydrogenase subunit 2 [Rhipicephalus appendiculatus]QNN85521.1 NADH dehydrogenase subunit 2 [Rhipicephalus appendiculatus]